MAADDSWFYVQDGEKRGPFAPEQIGTLVQAGVVTEHTKMWSESLGEWLPLYRTGLRPLLGDRVIRPPDLPPSIDRSADEAKLTALFYNDDTAGLLPRESATPAAAQAPRVKGSVVYNNRGVSKLLGLLIWANGVISGIQAFVLIIKSGGYAEKYRLALQMEGDQVMALVGIPFLVNAILFLIWKYRVTTNVVSTRGPQTITPWGAVYWYFVPVMWFWKPYEAMRNIVDGLKVQDHSRMKFWWALFWASIAIPLAGALIMPPDQVKTISQAKLYVLASIATYVLGALWCFAGAELVKQISAAEQEVR